MTTKSNALRAFDTLRQYVGEGDWKAEEIEGQHAFKSRKEGEHPRTYYFQIFVEQEQFLFKIVPVINLFEDLLAPAAEFTARANYGMRIGNFEVDFEAGRVTFKSSLNFKGETLTKAWIDNAVQPALTAFDGYYPGLLKVVAGIETPAEAIRKIEYSFE